MPKPKIRNAGNRSKGGRPSQAGDRTPGGRLKAPGPNQLIIERRKALCDDIRKATNPLDVAHYRGWIGDADYRTGLTYARLHAAAGFGRRHRGGSREVSPPTEVSIDVMADPKSFFAGLPHAEVVALWDAVFDDDGSRKATADQRAQDATRLWQAANAAMTAAQRQEVHRVCIEDSFPQWIIQRAAGRVDTSWEGGRLILIEGLRAIRRAIKPATAPTVPPPAPPAIADMRVVEREIRTQEGAVVLEVERVRRRLT